MSGHGRVVAVGLKQSLSLGLVLGMIGCTVPHSDNASQVYAARCASCHGVSGMGDGPVARKLPDAPTRFADTAWKNSVDPAYVKNVIAKGGSGVGISPLMPSNSDLSGNELILDELATFVLQL